MSPTEQRIQDEEAHWEKLMAKAREFANEEHRKAQEEKYGPNWREIEEAETQLRRKTEADAKAAKELLAHTAREAEFEADFKESRRYWCRVMFLVILALPLGATVGPIIGAIMLLPIGLIFKAVWH